MYNMSEYDSKAWVEVQAWRKERLNAAQRHLLPKVARNRLTRVGTAAQGRFKQMPGADTFHDLFFKALDGLVGTVNQLSIASVRRQAVLNAYRKRGHQITEISHIRKLELRDIDQAKPRLDLHYTIASTVEGAGAGLAMAGGEIAAAGGALVGAGAGAAPGAATVVGIMAADAAAVLVAATRAVAHTAAYYGYDVDSSDEWLYALGVLNFGLMGQAGRTAAYVELNKIVQALARNATWQQLDKNAVAQIVKTVYTALGMKITKEKLGQAVPVVGVVIGAGLNARTLARVTSDADHLYRERFLREKYGITAGPSNAESPVETDDMDSVDIVDIVDAELESNIDPSDDPDEPSLACGS